MPKEVEMYSWPRSIASTIIRIAVAVIVSYGLWILISGPLRTWWFGKGVGFMKWIEAQNPGSIGWGAGVLFWGAVGLVIVIGFFLIIKGVTESMITAGVSFIKDKKK